LQIVSIVLCAGRFAALALMRRTQELIAVVARTSAAWLKQGDGFAQNALLTETFLGREN
jgi:hypothetical protein